ncbi:MAG: hypothetical protein ACRETL_06950, partial [Gammaproteobacteria bacterium]
AFKGMMDTGNNIMPGCGPDRHKNPDCFMGPLAGVIAQGYLSGTVPLSATTSQVFQTVVIPWLKSGSGGLVNWGNLSREPIQQLMIQAATDRYLADQPMTRGDMDSYGHVGAHTPTLVQALQPILRQPTTTTPNVTSAPAPAPPSIMQPGMVTPDIPVGGGGPAAYAPNPVYTGGGGQALPQYPPYVPGSAVNNGQPLLPSPPGSLMTPAKPGGLAALIPWGLVIAAGAAILS